MIIRRVLFIVVLITLLICGAGAQQSSPSSTQHDSKAAATNDISGAYTFLREGEVLQLTLEEGELTGYISRFGDSASDKGVFIDQFLDKASLDGDRIKFNTKKVHGVWYEFSGVITTTPGKQPADEGYHVVKGILLEHSTDSKGAEKIRQREVEFKSFPAEVGR